MKRPTGKIKNATIVTKKSIHILIVQTRKRKMTMTKKIPSPAKKLNTVLKTCPNILIRLRRPLAELKEDEYNISDSDEES